MKSEIALELAEEDLAVLESSIYELVKDTPAATVSATRFKRIMGTIGQEAPDLFHELLVDIVSETAKKVIWPSG